jgi:hypothetical protein
LAEQTGVPGATGTGSRVIGPFLEHHILGIVARLTDIVNDPRDEWSQAEKRRSVKTLDELVKVAKKYSRIARPQVYTHCHRPVLLVSYAYDDCRYVLAFS